MKFEIRDTGIGIPEEHLPNIFLDFYQVEGGRSRDSGTGLGLAICQRLVRLMGGELHVASTPGQGSIFWFDIVLTVVDEAYLQIGPPDFPRILGYKGERRTILLVDDHDENRAWLKDTLTPLGFEIMEARNGRKALDAAKAYHPDLILMDLLMPVMDGFEATKYIKSEIRNSKSEIQTIIIGVSASVSEDVQQESRDAGCDDFLGKPVQIEELLNCLQRHLDLEWIYEDSPETGSRPSYAAEASPLVVPSQEVLRKLLELAEGRYLNDIQELLARLKESDPDLIPFAFRIEQLADELQFNQIIEYLTSHIESQT